MMSITVTRKLLISLHTILAFVHGVHQESKHGASNPLHPGTRRATEVSPCGLQYIQVTSICQMPNLEPSLLNGDAEMKVLLNDEVYWPQSRENCDLSGSNNEACDVPFDVLEREECFLLRNPTKILIFTPTTEVMTITILTILEMDVNRNDTWIFEFSDHSDDGCMNKEVEMIKDDGSSVTVSIFISVDDSTSSLSVAILCGAVVVIVCLILSIVVYVKMS